MKYFNNLEDIKKDLEQRTAAAVENEETLHLFKFNTKKDGGDLANLGPACEHWASRGSKQPAKPCRWHYETAEDFEKAAAVYVCEVNKLIEEDVARGYVSTFCRDSECLEIQKIKKVEKLSLDAPDPLDRGRLVVSLWGDTIKVAGRSVEELYKNIAGKIDRELDTAEELAEDLANLDEIGETFADAIQTARTASRKLHDYTSRSNLAKINGIYNSL